MFKKKVIHAEYTHIRDQYFIKVFRNYVRLFLNKVLCSLFKFISRKLNPKQ